MVNQRKYILDLLKETGMSGCQQVDTPVDANIKFREDKKSLSIDTT